MASGTLRDPTAVATGLGRWLAERRPGGPAVSGATHASDGLSNETVLIDLGGPPAGERLVVRLPPLEPLFPHYDLAMQAAVHQAAAADGVPAPAPSVFEPDPAYLGAPFLVMPFVAGHVPGVAPPLDPFVQEAAPADQQRLHDGFVDVLAAVHRVDWERAGLGSVLRGAASPLVAELAWWESYARWSGDGAPGEELDAALGWCRANLPAEHGSPVLLWGDPRLGNLVVDDRRRVVGVLDWEMATLGPPEMDLGWHLALDSAMVSLLGRRVAGFPDHAGTVARYEAVTGHRVRDLGFHETFALTRALAVNERQGALRGRALGRPRRPDPLAPLVAARLAGDPGRWSG